MPLHPAIVHLPLGLALALPLLVVPLAWAVWTGRLPRFAWALVLGAQVIVLGGGLLAMNSGEEDEERVERVVEKHLIHEHEDAAELFVWADAAVAAIALLGLALRDERYRRAAIAVATAGSVVVAGLGLRAGHRGGELVYRHGAAAAHVGSAGSATASEHEE